MHVRFLTAPVARVWSQHRNRQARRRLGFLLAALAAAALAAAVTAAAPTIASAAPSAVAHSPTWHSQRVPAGLADLHVTGISCAKDGKHCASDGYFCPLGGCGGLLLGSVLTTTNGGVTWKKRSVPANVGEFSRISCGSSTFCVAVADKGPIGPHVSYGFLVTSNGGGSWKMVAAPGNRGAQDVSCPGGTTCFATSFNGSNGAIDKTTDGGRSWTSKVTTASSLTAISCWSTSHCVAIADAGSAFMYTTNGGSSWHVVTAPGSAEVSAIACGSQSACFAAGTISDTFVALATTNGGKSWRSQALPSGLVLVGGIACASATRCVVAGSNAKNPLIMATTNGGSKWARQSEPAGSGALSEVWCSVKSYCIAVGHYAKYNSKGVATAVGPYILAN